MIPVWTCGEANNTNSPSKSGNVEERLVFIVPFPCLCALNGLSRFYIGSIFTVYRVPMGLCKLTFFTAHRPPPPPSNWQMVDAPCSRVGHIYRKFAPFPNPGIGDFMGRNYKRVAEVWMDEYKEYLYERKPYYRNLDAGDLTDLLALRKKLNCKPFSWFMKEVAFDLPKVSCFGFM